DDEEDDEKVALEATLTYLKAMKATVDIERYGLWVERDDLIGVQTSLIGERDGLVAECDSL
ncbi:hypothetical protein KI387_006556, partial [Taxus chinensis]